WSNGVGVLAFRQLVLDAPTLRPVEYVDFGSGQVIRSGSVFFSPNALAYYLLVAVAIVVARVVRRVAKPWEPWIAVLFTLCVFYTFSRSAMALLGLVGLVVAAGSGRFTRGAGAFVGAGVLLLLLVFTLG